MGFGGLRFFSVLFCGFLAAFGSSRVRGNTVDLGEVSPRVLERLNANPDCRVTLARLRNQLFLADWGRADPRPTYAALGVPELFVQAGISLEKIDQLWMHMMRHSLESPDPFFRYVLEGLLAPRVIQAHTGLEPPILCGSSCSPQPEIWRNPPTIDRQADTTSNEASGFIFVEMPKRLDETDLSHWFSELAARVAGARAWGLMNEFLQNPRKSDGASDSLGSLLVESKKDQNLATVIHRVLSAGLSAQAEIEARRALQISDTSDSSGFAEAALKSAKGIIVEGAPTDAWAKLEAVFGKRIDASNILSLALKLHGILTESLVQAKPRDSNWADHRARDFFAGISSVRFMKSEPTERKDLEIVLEQFPTIGRILLEYTLARIISRISVMRDPRAKANLAFFLESFRMGGLRDVLICNGSLSLRNIGATNLQTPFPEEPIDQRLLVLDPHRDPLAWIGVFSAETEVQLLDALVTLFTRFTQSRRVAVSRAAFTASYYLAVPLWERDRSASKLLALLQATETTAQAWIDAAEAVREEASTRRSNLEKIFQRTILDGNLDLQQYYDHLESYEFDAQALVSTLQSLIPKLNDRPRGSQFWAKTIPIVGILEQATAILDPSLQDLKKSWAELVHDPHSINAEHVIDVRTKFLRLWVFSHLYSLTAEATLAKINASGTTADPIVTPPDLYSALVFLADLPKALEAAIAPSDGEAADKRFFEIVRSVIRGRLVTEIQPEPLEHFLRYAKAAVYR